MRFRIWLCVLMFAVPTAAAHQNAASPQPLTLDALLTAYRGGDFAVLDRSFTRPRDFQTLMRKPDPRELDSWLRQWDPGKAVMLLDLAQVGFRVSPPYGIALVRAGRAYVAARTSADDEAFAANWHRTALGVLEGNGAPDLIDEYADALKNTATAKPPNGSVAGRLLLARGVAQERRCWDVRPTLDQTSIRLDELFKAAGAKVPADIDNPPPVSKAQLDLHQQCLKEALTRFESAAAVPEAHPEAHVRGGWVLFQQGKQDDALKWLDEAKVGGDRTLIYWLNLFRGRVLNALGRVEESADAFRAASALYPSAQTAGIGLSLQLFRLDQNKEADEVARAMRQVTGADPWFDYPVADRRFVADSFARLRKAIQ